MRSTASTTTLSALGWSRITVSLPLTATGAATTDHERGHVDGVKRWAPAPTTLTSRSSFDVYLDDDLDGDGDVNVDVCVSPIDVDRRPIAEGAGARSPGASNGGVDVEVAVAVKGHENVDVDVAVKVKIRVDGEGRRWARPGRRRRAGPRA